MRNRIVALSSVLVCFVVMGLRPQAAYSLCDCCSADPVFIQSDQREPEALLAARAIMSKVKKQLAQSAGEKSVPTPVVSGAREPQHSEVEE